MKISNRGGHTKASPGASALLDEIIEDRKLNLRISALLSEFNQMISSQPNDGTSYPTELLYGINIANSNKVNFAYSIHLNKAYTRYNGAIGVEILLNLENSETVTIGNRILKNMENLGFINRGLKDGKRFGEINSIVAGSMIIEICFVEATEDVALYNSLGIDKISRAVANGIDGRVNLTRLAPVILIPIVEPKPTIEYSGHIQNIGWMKEVREGEICGTVGKELRLEALNVIYFGPGVLKSQVHIQNYGWTAERLNGEILGTTGMALRTEAFKFRLEGTELHIEYRTHIQDIGWLPWSKDGSINGTIGQSKRVEAIQIRIVK